MGSDPFHMMPSIEPTSAKMNPKKNPPAVKSAPTIAKTRTSTAPVLTLDLVSLFISNDPTTITTPQSAPTTPTTATRVCIFEIPDKAVIEPTCEEAAAIIIPTIK